MPNFCEFMDRHGEFGVQAIIERIERQEGIAPHTEVPLEDRWNILMSPASQTEHRSAA